MRGFDRSSGLEGVWRGSGGGSDESWADILELGRRFIRRFSGKFAIRGFRRVIAGGLRQRYRNEKGIQSELLHEGQPEHSQE
eukprot:1196328-Prorocentrum_minimum.AAC.2